MAEYIDRKLFCENFCRCNAAECAKVGFEKCPIFICPTADVEHVIRCKNCRHSDDFPFSKKETIYCNMHDVTMCENDFCSRGKPKDEEKEEDGKQ